MRASARMYTKPKSPSSSVLPLPPAMAAAAWARCAASPPTTLISGRCHPAAMSRVHTRISPLARDRAAFSMDVAMCRSVYTTAA